MTTAHSSPGRGLPSKEASVIAKGSSADTTEKSSITEPGPEPDREYVTGIKLFVIVASIAFASFLKLLDSMIVSTVGSASKFPSHLRITDDFHSLVDVGWYASAYQFGSSAPQPLTGRIYKYFDTKWTYLVFFFIFEIGSVICGAATSSPMFIVGRLIAGFGGAGITTGSITMISLCAPLEKRPLNFLGLVLGPLVGGAFTTYTSWRWCFYVNVPVGGLAVLAILRRINHYLDLIGFILFSPAILQLLLALQFGGQAYPWNSSQVIGLFCGAAATSVVWGFWNRYRRDDAMMPRSMLRQRNVLFSGVYVAFLTSASAVYLLPMILSQLIMAGLAGVAVSKIGYVIPVAIFSTVLLSIGTGLYSLLQPGSSSAKWIIFQILGGVGFGAGLQLPVVAVQVAMNGEELASSIAFVIFSQAFGPTIAMTLYNIIFLKSMKSQVSRYAPNVSPTAIINAGATGFRSFVSPVDLPGVLKAYANSIGRVFYLAAALSAACGIFLCGMGWHDLRAKKGNDPSPKGNGTKPVISDRRY
ncbi:major facilitator superfamily domain-containing protein [Phaeosphaeriaceae sp. PMI808]|nr:major facilitator superfamily domain-containing protein [Phaeosphaeriaceae sp. PMI808]